MSEQFIPQQQAMPPPIIQGMALSFEEFIDSKYPNEHRREFLDMLALPSKKLCFFNMQMYEIALAEADILILDYIMAAPPPDSDWVCSAEGVKKRTNEDIRMCGLIKHDLRFEYTRGLDGATAKLLFTNIHVNRQEGMPIATPQQHGGFRKFFSRTSGGEVTQPLMR